MLIGWRRSRPKGSRYHRTGRESFLLVGGVQEWGTRSMGPRICSTPNCLPGSCTLTWHKDKLLALGHSHMMVGIEDRHQNSVLHK